MHLKYDNVKVRIRRANSVEAMRVPMFWRNNRGRLRILMNGWVLFTNNHTDPMMQKVGATAAMMKAYMKAIVDDPLVLNDQGNGSCHRPDGIK